MVIGASGIAVANDLGNVKVLEPAEGAVLAGEVTVRVEVTPAPDGSQTSALHAGFGGRPWCRLERQSPSENVWIGQLDTTMVPNGSQPLTIVTDRRRTDVTMQVALDNPLTVFFADLHSHTNYSDGSWIPAEAHAHARDVVKLDVFALADHLELLDEVKWRDMRETAWDANEDGTFVAIPALEWTKAQGHTCIYDPGAMHWPEETAAFYEAVANAGVVVKFNHPGRGDKVFDGLAYSEAGDKAVQLMEVRKPKEEKAFIRALKNGWHIAPEGSDDTHEPNWGECDTWTGILSPGLSKRNIMDALKNRRCYSTNDRNCLLSFTVNGAAMGAVVAEPAKRVELTVTVTDPDKGDDIARIDLFEDGRIVLTDKPNATSREWASKRSPEAGEHYYFARVTQADGNMIWSAPVWVTVAAEQPEE